MQTTWSDVVPGAGHLEGAVGRSRALRTHWLYAPRFDLMFDAGDGASQDLGIQLGSPNTLAVTHGHGDHVLGLPALLAARQFPSLHSGGPLSILYPAGCRSISALRELLKGMWPHTSWDRIQWIEMKPGSRYELGKTRFLEAFEVEHSPHLPCLGYAVVETRKRRTALAESLGTEEMVRRIKAGERSQMEERYEQTLLAYSGDCLRAHTERFQDADVLIHDCTFLSTEDRDEPTHASLEEVLSVAQQSNVKTLVLSHLSLRYDRTALTATLRQMLEGQENLPPVFLWDEDQVLRVY